MALEQYILIWRYVKQYKVIFDLISEFDGGSCEVIVWWRKGKARQDIYISSKLVKKCALCVLHLQTPSHPKNPHTQTHRDTNTAHIQQRPVQMIRYQSSSCTCKQVLHMVYIYIYILAGNATAGKNVCRSVCMCYFRRRQFFTLNLHLLFPPTSKTMLSTRATFRTTLKHKDTIWEKCHSLSSAWLKAMKYHF